MEGLIEVAAGVLVIAYIGWAIWFIWKRQTLWGAIGATAGFLCGGFVIIPVAMAVASFLVYVVAIFFVLAIIGALFG